MPKYQKPNFFTKNIFNPFLMLLTRVGLSLRGSRTLAVRGRKSGGISCRLKMPAVEVCAAAVNRKAEQPEQHDDHERDQDDGLATL